MCTGRRQQGQIEILQLDLERIAASLMLILVFVVVSRISLSLFAAHTTQVNKHWAYKARVGRIRALEL